LISAPLPANEPERLRELYSYRLLDTDPERAFDELAELAAEICEVPIALISLVDQSRQWFKARVGLDAVETARSVAFCAHAILQSDVFIVPDALLDVRFADNPLVTGPPHVRFYAGAPLLTPEGHGLGTLCVIDRVPRQLTPHQKKALTVLRQHVLTIAELHRQHFALQALSQELDAFAYSVAHDLRAPLRAMDGFSRCLADEYGGKLDERGREYLKRIRAGATRMGALIDDLLNLSRVSRQEMRSHRVDLSELAREVGDGLRAQYASRDVELAVADRAEVFGDRGLLRIALENLLDNAWKYSATRAPARVEFGIETRTDGKTFFVRDNGVGFDMRYADKLFGVFHRLDATAQYEGTGIGLAIVARVIARHNGKIWAEGVPDKGATFYFTLPA
jgi:signal transduction histidine kinase